jgi:hypothetical protein
LAGAGEHRLDDFVDQPSQRHANRSQDQVVGPRADEVDEQVASGGEINYASRCPDLLERDRVEVALHDGVIELELNPFKVTTLKLVP